MMRRNFLFQTVLLILVNFIFAFPSFSQSSQPFKAFVNNPDKPLNIEADEAIVSQGDQSAVFKGNVVITQDESRLTANSVSVIYEGKLLSASTSRGVKELSASGKVRISLGVDYATADSMVYVFATGVGVMEGNVRLVQGRNTSKGSKLQIDTSRGIVHMFGGKSGRVKAVLNPN